MNCQPDMLPRLQFHFGLRKVKTKMEVCGMASVSELVEDVAEVMQEPVETVSAYARALIDAGLLPKSRGRAIAQVTVEHIVKLFLAVAIAPKIKDAATEVSRYFNMKRPGITDDFPESMKGIAGAELCDLVETILGPVEDEEAFEFRKRCFNSRIALTLNWPEIEIHIGGGILRFKDGGYPDLWQGYVKRTVEISGRAFPMLGFGKEGRDYRKWEA